MYAEKRIITITDVPEAAGKRKMESCLFVQQCTINPSHVEIQLTHENTNISIQRPIKFFLIIFFYFDGSVFVDLLFLLISEAKELF